MQDLFSEMFSGGVGGGFGRQQARRGGDLRVQQRLTLEEAAFGARRRSPSTLRPAAVTAAAPEPRRERSPRPARTAGGPGRCRMRAASSCSRPRARGARGRGPSSATHASRVRGTAWSSGHARSWSRSLRASTPVNVCAFPGKGCPGQNGASAGDLYVEIDVEEDARFERDGAESCHARPRELHGGVARSGDRGACDRTGGPREEGPAVAPGGDAARRGDHAEGAGRSLASMGAVAGSLVVVVQVEVPKTLSARARELLAELDGELASSAEEGESSRRRSAVAGGAGSAGR